MAEVTAAARLRALSGLPASRLAAVFGVSRATYQNWIAGRQPLGARREHLLEVLALVAEAAHRFETPRAVGDWLLTPVGTTWHQPIVLLAERNSDTFRGYVLRLPPGRERARRRREWIGG